MPAAASLTRGLWSSAAIALVQADDRLPKAGRTPHDLQNDYWRLVYPAGRPATAESLVTIDASRRQPRHVLLVILETAPREFYRLIDNDALPSLRSMSQHALVSDHHVTAAPRTDLAIYSMMSGTYPRSGAPLYEFGRFKTDGLATVLGARNYRATYIDSITLKWNVREEALAVNDLGFPTVIEESDAPLPASADSYEDALARERTSLSLAHTAILEAERRGEKALVAVATNFGHFPWRAMAGRDAEPSASKVAGLAHALDRLMADVLTRLDADRLANDVLIVIVGDHGLRFSVEFDSFGTPMRLGDLMFNVPLMIYSPALFPQTVRLPWVTSHVDIEPTVLDLLGVPRDGLLLHGENMLDRRLADRVTILPSGMFPPMYPVDGLHYRGTFHTWAYATRSRPVAACVPRPNGSDAAAGSLQIRCARSCATAGVCSTRPPPISSGRGARNPDGGCQRTREPARLRPLTTGSRGALGKAGIGAAIAAIATVIAWAALTDGLWHVS